MDFRSGELIMAGSTDDTTLNLTTDLPDTGNPVIVVGIRVVSGTVKFGNGESAASNNGFTSADGVIYTLHSNNVCPLHFDANNAADTFVIVVVAV